jgi:hypothetical protein
VYPFEDLNLAPGAAGVFSILDDVNDGFAPVNLAGNTFNFYGTVYPSLFVSSNGLITFGSGNSAATNTDLTTAPAQAAIAPLWDDWRTDLDANDQVLGKFEDTDGDGTADRLIVQWHAVQHAPNSPSAVTFQAILSLNTAIHPGAIVFNYPDLDAANPVFDNGLSATVGIKASGTQGPNRLLVSLDSLSVFVGSGQALRLSVP